MIVRRLATITASVAIALAGSAAVPSLASASAGHGLAKAAHGVAWTGKTAGQKPTGVTWTGSKPAGVTWTAQKPSGVAWTR